MSQKSKQMKKVNGVFLIPCCKMELGHHRELLPFYLFKLLKTSHI